MNRVSLKEFAKYLKDKATKSELKLHKELTDLEIKFKFQHIIEPFIVDFYFPDSKSIVELDGKKFHNKIKDASRDLYLTNAGYRIYRIKSYRCFKDMKTVLNEITRFLNGETVKVERKRKKSK